MALTGGIGSGKSTVAKRLVELGATEIDSDLLAREVVAPGTEGLAAVLEAFGEDLFVDGALDRQRLAQRAFSTEQKRKQLEEILHPRIQQLAKQKIAQLEGIIIYTIPLLVEVGDRLGFDRVITVSCPEDVRIARLTKSRGMSESDARARIASQATDEQREAIADFVINSDCSLAELMQQTEQVFRELEGEKR
ncbi:MAG: dephospho-CoA kinase [Actinobacteria bacterium]|nr:dephospho-CoA kinase [Actinomycetota bacterium]